MPRRCTVCDHDKRPEIDRALVADGASYRDIARQFRASKDALYRHACEHLPERLTKAREAKDAAQATDLMRELQDCMGRVRLVLDACDRWLRDADDPTRYEIGPRAPRMSR